MFAKSQLRGKKPINGASYKVTSVSKKETPQYITVQSPILTSRSWGGWGRAVQPIWSSAFWVVDCRWREGGERMRLPCFKKPFMTLYLFLFPLHFLVTWTRNSQRNIQPSNFTSSKGGKLDQATNIKKWRAWICENVQIHMRWRVYYPSKLLGNLGWV